MVDGWLKEQEKGDRGTFWVSELGLLAAFGSRLLSGPAVLGKTTVSSRRIPGGEMEKVSLFSDMQIRGGMKGAGGSQICWDSLSSLTCNLGLL